MSTKKTPKKAASKATAEETVTTPQVEATTQSAEGAQAEQPKPQVALFGQLGFETVAHYDEYIARMKQSNYNDILLTVNVALRAVQQRGGFSLEESEAVAVSLRYLNAAFTAVPAEEAQVTETAEATTEA